MQRLHVTIIALSLLMLSGCGGDDQESGQYGDEAAGEKSDATLAIEKLLAGEGAGKEVISSASGLQYIDLAPGSGDKPSSGQTCSTHATLWLLDGTKIWSSRDPGPGGLVQPFEFKLGAGQVIPGWEEGVADMRPGGQRRLAVPPELGYGEKGRAPSVPPNATLIFEVELLEIKN